MYRTHTHTYGRMVTAWITKKDSLDEQLLDQRDPQRPQVCRGITYRYFSFLSSLSIRLTPNRMRTTTLPCFLVQVTFCVRLP